MHIQRRSGEGLEYVKGLTTDQSSCPLTATRPCMTTGPFHCMRPTVSGQENSHVARRIDAHSNKEKEKEHTIMSQTATRTTTSGQVIPNTQDDVQYMPTQSPSQPYQQGTTTGTQYDPQQSGKLAPLQTTTATTSWMPQLRLIAKLMGIGLLVWAIVTAAITTYNWGVDQYNTYHYGPTRVYATTAVLGLDGDNEGNPSDIAILNFRGNLELLVNPAGDTTKTQTYSSGRLISDGASKTPAYVTFKRNTQNHKLDIVVHIVGQSQLLTYTNTGTGYALVKQ